ncbi:MAG: nucleotidyl transferase AbiEii/AbiGii toxin family protein [Actinobacteria bacterium]|nr:nucleotidyl transferase AbiEii/AbiGii toxin family protein [Actinomycetota bacterium]
MSRPTRETAAGRAYRDLQALARTSGRPTDELFVLYVLERFLFRLSLSRHRDHFILKGGMLLAAFGDRRPTRDVDLLAVSIANDVETVASIVRDVLDVEVDDGVVFEPDRLTSETIREFDLYAGVRLTVPARLHRAEVPLRLDVNVGDPVVPAPAEVPYPALLGDPFPVIGYPIETVLAEKIVTMVARGDTTTRERDFADVVLLVRRNDIDGALLSAAVTATAGHRATQLRPLREILVTLGEERQGAWAAFLRRSGLTAELAAVYEDVITEVIRFADPVIAGEASRSRWSAFSSGWQVQ